jgi:hypothetical protein
MSPILPPPAEPAKHETRGKPANGMPIFKKSAADFQKPTPNFQKPVANFQKVVSIFLKPGPTSLKLIWFWPALTLSHHSA